MLTNRYIKPVITIAFILTVIGLPISKVSAEPFEINKAVHYHNLQQIHITQPGYYYVEAFGGDGGKGAEYGSNPGGNGGEGGIERGLFRFEAGTTIYLQAGLAGKDAGTGSQTDIGMGGTGTFLADGDKNLYFGKGGDGGNGGSGSKVGHAGGGGGAASGILVDGKSENNIYLAAVGGGGGGGGNSRSSGNGGQNHDGTWKMPSSSESQNNGGEANGTIGGNGGAGQSGNFSYDGGGGGGGAGGGFTGGKGGAGGNNSNGLGGGGAGGRRGERTIRNTAAKPSLMVLPTHDRDNGNNGNPDTSLGKNGDLIITYLGVQATVTLDDNGGGEGSGSAQWFNGAMYPGASITPGDVNVPTREHYNFSGYYNNSGGTQYVDKDGKKTENWTNWKLNGNTSLSARWEHITFDVTEKYQADGGTELSDDTHETVNSGDSYVKSAPGKTDYTAVGYQVDELPPVYIDTSDYGWNTPNETVMGQIDDVASTHTIIFLYEADDDGNGIPDTLESVITVEQTGRYSSGTTILINKGTLTGRSGKTVTADIIYDNIESAPPGWIYRETAVDGGTPTSGPKAPSVTFGTNTKVTFFYDYTSVAATLTIKCVEQGSNPQNIFHKRLVDNLTADTTYSAIAPDVGGEWTLIGSMSQEITLKPGENVITFEYARGFIYIKGHAKLSGKQRTDLPGYYIAGGRNFDAGITVELVKAQSLTEFETVAARVYTGATEISGINFTLPVPVKDALLFETNPYFIRFSRFDGIPGSGNERDERYLCAEISINAEADDIRADAEYTIVEEVYLTAGAFNTFGAGKEYITAADIAVIKALVGYSDDELGGTSIYNVNEYLGVDPADYATVQSYLGRGKYKGSVTLTSGGGTVSIE